jgi:hypothetical protein
MPVPTFRPAHEVCRRCRRPAELAGATGAAKRRWHRAMAMSAEQQRAGAMALGGGGSFAGRPL